MNADVAGRYLSFVPITVTNSPGGLMKATNGGILYFNPVVGITNTGATIQAARTASVQFESSATITGGTVSSEAPGTVNGTPVAGGTIQIRNSQTANGAVTFANAGTTIVGSVNGTQTFAGLDNGGSSFVNSGTIRKISSPEFHFYTALTNSAGGAIVNEAGNLRFFGSGVLANASIATAAGANTGFQAPGPYTFSGINSFTGAGGHFMSGNSLVLTDVDTQINATNFNFDSGCLLTGPGRAADGRMAAMSISGALQFAYTTTTIAGAKLINLAGSTGVVDIGGAQPLSFTNGAQWENSGTVTMQGYINMIDGEPGTLFTNTASGILRGGNAQTNVFAMPYLNSGRFDVVGGVLPLRKSGTFRDGAATIASGTVLSVENSVLSLEGQANTSTGLGIFKMAGTSSMALMPDSKLSADKLHFHDSSSAAGTGVVDVAKDLRFSS